MRHSLTLASLPFLLAALSLPGGATAVEAGDDLPVRTWTAVLGKPAPEFELPILDGKSWKLSEQKGRVVVLEWFNPDCPYVVKAHGAGGALHSLGNEATSGGVVWVAINSAYGGHASTGAKRNRKAVTDFGLEYPVLLDEASWVGSMYGAKTTPYMCVIDAKGKLVYAGAHADQESGANLVAAALAELRAGKKVSRPRTQSYGCGVKYPPAAELGLVAPAFTLPSVDGKEVSLSSYRGRIVVLEWFNPSCPVVRAAHDGGALEGAAARAAEKEIAWLAVNSGAPGKQGHGADANARAAKEWGMVHPILMDESGKVGKAYGARTTPHMYVIDPRGVLVYAGAHDDRGGTRYVEQALRELLAGKPVSVPRTDAYGCGVKYAN